VVVLSHSSFSFEDLDQHSWLIVSISSENLGFLGGDGSVSWDQDCHDTSSGFNTLR
jgi:hypothetical protein